VAAEAATREMGRVSLVDALDCLALWPPYGRIASSALQSVGTAGWRWKRACFPLTNHKLALAALGSMRAGDAGAVAVLQRLLRRVQPTLIRRLT
jgi:hypothetical protein